MSIEIKPINLITPYRFDLMIKYLYGKSILRDYQTVVFKQFYYDHIEKWNGFNEPNSTKNSFDDFDWMFKKLIEDFKNNKFDFHEETIPVMSWFQGFTILNGAHRTVAALLASNERLLCKDINLPKLSSSQRKSVDRGISSGELSIIKTIGVFDASWITRFSKHGLDPMMTDLAAIQYAKLKSTAHVAILFPSASEKHEDAINILNNQFRGKVVYTKQVYISPKGQINLMNEFYGDEKWIGSKDDNYSGLQYKARKCFTQNTHATICLLDYENLDEVVKAKSEVRELCGISNHSIHISDYHDQSIELSRLFFNKNSLNWLNDSNMHEYQFFERLLRLFKHEIQDNAYDIDEYCITASSVLSAYGLRQGDDLDYIKINDAETLHSHGYQINCHNKYGTELKIYDDSYDELIMNPKNHFYYKGVKFLSLENIMKMKITRGEDKDKKDLQLISSLYDDIV